MVDFIMGLGLALPLATSIGVATVTGIAEGVSYQRKQNEEMASETRQLKFHLDCYADASASASASASTTSRDQSGSRSRRARDAVQDTMLVLSSDRVYLSPRDKTTRQPSDPTLHPFTGFYVPYPDPERQPPVRGLVSTVSRDPPVLNWIYVENETGRMRYANRTGSIAHNVGEWDWTAEHGPESRLTFQGWEGFMAVEEDDGRWGVYVDIEDDGLKSRKECKGKRKVELMLKRRLISEQEVNKWGLGSSGNLGVKKTEHSVKGKDMLKEEEGG